MNPVNAHHAHSGQCGSKGFQIVAVLLGSGDILRKFTNQCLVFCHWAAANHLTVFNQSGFHNNVRFIPLFSDDGTTMLPIRASAARLGVMLPNFVRRFQELPL